MSNSIYAPQGYYVYAYIRSKDSSTAKAGTPYYIGKGTKKRMYRDHGNTPVPKDRRFIIILESNLSEIGAFALERRYIKWFGRKDINTGILLNRTNGGEGKTNPFVSEDTRNKLSIANIGKTLTEEHKRKIGESNKGKIRTDEMCVKYKENRLKRKPLTHTEETKQKISEANKGKIRSSETRTKCSIAKAGKPSYRKGKICINNGTTRKYILAEELELYLSEGWHIKETRSPHTQETKDKISATKSLVHPQ